MAGVNFFSRSTVMWMCLCFAAVAVSLCSGAALTVPTPTVADVYADNNSTTASNDTTSTQAPGTSLAPNTTESNTTSANHTTAVVTTQPPQNTTHGNLTTENPLNTTTENPTNLTTTSSDTNVTTAMTSHSTGPSGPTTTGSPPSSDGRKFDAASFFGGMALVVGLVLIGFIAWKCYTSKKNTYHAM